LDEIDIKGKILDEETRNSQKHNQSTYINLPKSWRSWKGYKKLVLKRVLDSLGREIIIIYPPWYKEE